jgi:hypothetical protein
MDSVKGILFLLGTVAMATGGPSKSESRIIEPERYRILF